MRVWRDSASTASEDAGGRGRSSHVRCRTAWWCADNGRELAGVRKEDPVRTGSVRRAVAGLPGRQRAERSGFSALRLSHYPGAGALQFGVLRATGLSTNQLVAALATEQLTLIAAGVLIGTVLGGAAGWMFTRFLQLSIIARGRAAFPGGNTVGIDPGLYGILVIIFVAALLVSVYLLRKMRVATVLRLGEQ